MSVSLSVHTYICFVKMQNANQKYKTDCNQNPTSVMFSEIKGCQQKNLSNFDSYKLYTYIKTLKQCMQSMLSLRFESLLGWRYNFNQGFVQRSRTESIFHQFKFRILLFAFYWLLLTAVIAGVRSSQKWQQKMFLMLLLYSFIWPTKYSAILALLHAVIINKWVRQER